MENKELKECFFTPRLKTQNSNHRTLSQFLEDQNNFLKLKQKTAMPKEKLEINSSVKKNKIDINSKNSIHERLYSLCKRPITEEEVKPQPQPKVREKRELKLYQLAFNKTKKEVISEKKLEYKIDNDPYVKKAFKKEFTKALETVKIIDGDKVDYEDMLKIMKAMGFVQANSNGQIIHLVNALWTLIKVPEQNAVLIQKLELYIAAIANIRLNLLGIAPMTLSEISKIASDYKLLYINKMSNTTKKELKANNDNLTFSPSLCKESIKIAKCSLLQDSTKNDQAKKAKYF